MFPSNQSLFQGDTKLEIPQLTLGDYHIQSSKIISLKEQSAEESGHLYADLGYAENCGNKRKETGFADSNLVIPFPEKSKNKRLCPESSTIDNSPRSWTCSLCTFLNESSLSNQCEICGHQDDNPRPTKKSRH